LVSHQYDVILTFGVGLAKLADIACLLFYRHSPYSLVVTVAYNVSL